MSGNREQGLKAAATNKAKFGEDFYRKIGTKGGKVGRTGGFYANRELARIAGAKGGKKSRRNKLPENIAPEMTGFYTKLRRLFQ